MANIIMLILGASLRSRGGRRRAKARARASISGVCPDGSIAGGGGLEERWRKAQTHLPKVGRDEMLGNGALFDNGPDGQIECVLSDILVLSQSMICKKGDMRSKYPPRVFGRNPQEGRGAIVEGEEGG